jgi:hypothetical protein
MGFCESNIESVIISKDIEKIGSSAFQRCKILTKVQIEEGVTEIGDDAFESCTNLKVVTLPKSLKKIGWSAFKNCVSLESILIPEGVILEMDAFEGCKAMSEVILSDGVKLNSSSFKECRNVKRLQLPSDIVEIPYECFKSLGIMSGVDNQKIEIPKSVKKIGSYAFWGCQLMPSKLILSPDIEIGGGAFTGSNLTEVVIPDGSQKCDNSIFAGCDQLKKVTLSSTVKVIGHSAFRGCKSLESVEIPNGVEEVGENTFRDCSKLSSITLPESVKIIGNDAFEGCASLKTILIPDSVRELTNIPEYYTFKNTPFFLITPVESEFGDKIRYTRMYDIGQKYDFSADDFYFTINEDGETVTIVGDYFRCYNKPSVEIPAHVEYGGKNYIVTGIDNGAFASCYNLKEITMPEGITSIGEMAFVNCSGLTSIDLPESVNYIGLYPTFEKGPG